MSDSQWQNELTPVLRMLQIIVGSLVTGCIAFLAVIFLVADQVAGAGDGPIMTSMAIGFACMILVARMVAAGIIVAQGRSKILRGTWRMPSGRGSQPINAELIERTGDAGRLAALYTIRTIVAAALLEGAAFFSLIAYLIEGSQLALIEQERQLAAGGKR